MALSLRTHWKLAAVGASCLAAGASAGAIANASATAPAGASATAAPARPHHAHGARSLLARALHADAVVATKAGFATVTFDRGFVESVVGQQLTLREGTKTRTYKTLTLTIPANAVVRDNGVRTTLAAVKPGQRALVVQGLRRTFVIARTPPGS